MTEKQEQTISYSTLDTLAREKQVGTTLLDFHNKVILIESLAPGFLWFLTQGSADVLRVVQNGNEMLIASFTKEQQLVLTANIFKSLLGQPPDPQTVDYFRTTAHTKVRGFCFTDLVSYSQRNTSGKNFLANLYFYISDALRSEVASVTEKIADNQFLLLPQKFAKTLLAQQSIQGDMLQITHRDLAEQHHTYRETVTEILIKMAKMGFIEQGRMYIRILNKEGLQQVLAGTIKMESSTVEAVPTATATPQETVQ